VATLSLSLIFQHSQVGNGNGGYGDFAYSINLGVPPPIRKRTQYCLFRFINREPTEDLYALSLAPHKRNR